MTKLAFLGLGTMGAPMAGWLAKAGHAVTVWNRSPARGVAFAARFPGLSKLLAGFGTPLAGRLLMLDARRMAFDEIQVARQKDCPVCGPVQSRPETPDA